MKYLKRVIFGWVCLSSALYAVTVNTTNVPDYPQPPVPPLIEGTTTDLSDSDITPTPEPAPVVHTVYPTVIDETPEYEDSETIAFPPDSGNQGATDKAASITLSCKPVEYGTPVTTIKTIPVFVVISLDDLIFPIKTNKTREDKKTTYGMRWLAPEPGFRNDLTIEGIDVDNDCVRDDIENYIYRKFSGPGNIAKRKYMFEYAKWLGARLQSSISESTAKAIFNNIAAAGECINRIIGDSAATEIIDDLFANFHNTFPRSYRYIDNLKQTSGWTTRETISVSCP